MGGDVLKYLPIFSTPNKTFNAVITNFTSDPFEMFADGTSIPHGNVFAFKTMPKEIILCAYRTIYFENPCLYMQGLCNVKKHI